MEQNIMHVNNVGPYSFTYYVCITAVGFCAYYSRVTPDWPIPKS